MPLRNNPPEKEFTVSGISIKEDKTSVDGPEAAQTGPTRRVRPVIVLLWCALCVLSLYISILVAVGDIPLLRRAVRARPYASFYIEKDWVKKVGGESTDRLVFFFGDSTVLAGRNSKGQGVAEMLELELRSRYSELGKVTVIRKAFGGATLFHFYCLMFQAEHSSPDLLIIPINWTWLGAETDYWHGKQHLNQMASMVPISELFSSDKGNPLRYAGISLLDMFFFRIDKYVLCATGMKIWVREKFRFPPLRVENVGVQWLPFGSGGYQTVLCPEHRSVDILHCMSKTAERRNIPILFYLSPIPLYAVEQSPTFDRDLFECSVDRLLTASTTRTTQCVDLTGLLGAKRFTDGLHYTSRGHRDLAAALAPEAYEMLKGQTGAKRAERSEGASYLDNGQAH